MLATARQVVARGGLQDRITLARADATAFDPAWLFGVPSLSRIFFSYSLSMIPGWTTALSQAIGWLAPGGELHIVDFGGQERLPAWFRAGLRRWLTQFHVSPRDQLESELCRHGGAVIRFDRFFGGYAQYAVFRRAGLD